jgi:hypothetical protein
MQLKAKKNFSWAHRGVQVEHYEAGQVIETEDQDLIAVSTSEGWTGMAEPKATNPAESKTNKPTDNKAKKAAPENK